jgi:type III secretion protein N (ATPase)
LRTVGPALIVALPGARVGDGVRVTRAGGLPLGGEVVAVQRARATIAPFGSLEGIGVGDRVELEPGPPASPRGFAALGRALDAAGAPLDGGPVLEAPAFARLREAVPAPSKRRPIREVFRTGVRAVDALLTIGRGARVGFFGAPGAGKTTLLETIVGAARADAVVLALVGERGREAERWFARVDRRTTVFCATSDRSPAERARAADAALEHARALSEGGLHVLLLLDSLARYAGALREVRTALGEPVGRGGYPPTVWAALARYLEGAGNGARGSITLLATVLADGDDEHEPLAEAARSLLDGHIVLSSDLARAGRFPAIDVLSSASRTMNGVVSREHGRAAAHIRSALALLAQTSDARALGLADRSQPALAAALAAEPELSALVHRTEPSGWRATQAALYGVAQALGVADP